MKLVTYSTDAGDRLGILGLTGSVLDLCAVGFEGPRTMLDFIAAEDSVRSELRRCLQQAQGRVECWHSADSVRLAAPIPTMKKNVYCVGRNYKLHIEESARAKGIPTIFPTVPEFFSKPTTAIIGPEAGIRRNAALTAKLDYEVELGIVIGRRIRDVTLEEARDAIFGYTIINDISARDLQMAHGQWFKGKALGTFCPIGPCIVTADSFGDPANHRIALRVNGETRQNSSTSDLLFGIYEIVSRLSMGQTLEPGDMIATGTPSGVAFGMHEPRYLDVGDIVEAEIEGIGVLRNPVIE